MGPAGLIFIAIGGLLLRQVFMGRVDQTGTDLRTIGYSAVTGDFNTLSDTLTTRGSGFTSTSPSSSPAITSPNNSGVVPDPKAVAASGGLAATMIQLGNGRSYSQLKRTGPDSYDCSGLVYAAMKRLGYKGPVFWTGSFAATMGTTGAASRVNVSSPSAAPVDTIVLWSGKHMGVISSPGILYSARSSKLNPNIGPENLSDFISEDGSPTYWRMN